MAAAGQVGGVLATWRTSCRATAFLIENVPDEVWRSTIPGAPRRAVHLLPDLGMRDRTLHRLFALGVIVKGLDGALEVAGGVLFLVAAPRTLNAMVRFLTAHEISEDPADLIANLLRQSVRHLSVDTTLFAGAYLLGHGLTKLFLVAGLLRGKLWAYPAALWFLAAFVLYQVYRILLTHFFPLIGLTVFDLAVMSLIWREYHVRKQARLPRA